MFKMLRMKIRYVGWRCTFGRHRGWYLDCAVYFSVNRCKRCGEPESKAELQMVEEERAIRARVPKNLSLSKQESWVLKHIGERASSH